MIPFLRGLAADALAGVGYGLGVGTSVGWLHFIDRRRLRRNAA